MGSGKRRGPKTDAAMVDFHSHVLPQMDDGSRSLEESISLLRMLADQGVDLVAATPHFYADREPPERFLARRTEASEKLRSGMAPDLPNVRLGAEVAYFPGVSRIRELPSLLLEGTRLLLLEMPVGHWGQYVVREVLELSCSGAWTVVLAHIERYFSMQKADIWESLLENGVQMQVNASFFLSRRTCGKALRMLRNGRIHWIGSDCHNLTARPPQIGDASEVIRRKLGDGWIAEFDARNRSGLK